MPEFRRRIELDHSAEAVYRWHTRTGAFRRLLPPWERIEVEERAPGLREGGRVRGVLWKGPLPIRWEVEHAEVEEGRMFRDVQVSGPFRRWVHTHRFLPRGEGGCIVEDEVTWEPPLGSAGASFTVPVGTRELGRAFAFRHQRLAGDLEALQALGSLEPAGDPLVVAVSGSSGFIGSSLRDLLRAGGHRVVRLVRSREEADGDPDAIFWSVSRSEIDADSLEGVDAVVHLAGEPIEGIRWTRAKKEAIRRSRVEGTRLLARTLAGLQDPPKVLVCASGVNVYGDRGDEVLTEESFSGEGFLADVVREWEEAADPARRGGIRVVHLRTAMVLSPAGGALGTMLLPFWVGVGGRLGSGRQFVSWIDHDDHLALILHAIGTPELRGPVNAAAPHPVTNATFTTVLGEVLRRPTVLPVPALALKAALGEMGEELLLSSVRAMPRKARESGFRWRFPGLEDSLRFQLGRLRDPGESRGEPEDEVRA